MAFSSSVSLHCRRSYKTSRVTQSSSSRRPSGPGSWSPAPEAPGGTQAKRTSRATSPGTPTSLLSSDLKLNEVLDKGVLGGNSVMPKVTAKLVHKGRVYDTYSLRYSSAIPRLNIQLSSKVLDNYRVDSKAYHGLEVASYQHSLNIHVLTEANLCGALTRHLSRGSQRQRCQD